MAISYYPNRIRIFQNHQNLLDDLDANHINSIQAELHAVMLSLGTSPQVYNDIQTDNIPTAANPSDEGGVIDDDTIFQGVTRYYDPKVKPVDHGSVGQRMDDIERGKQFHAFRMQASNLDIISTSTSLSTRPRGVRFPKPTGPHDPFEMHNGAGVTLRKSGFWLLSGNIIYNLQGKTANSNNGIYQASIDHDGGYLDSMVRDQEVGSDKYPVLNPFLMDFLSAGTRISLRTSQDSGRTQKVRQARMSGILIRETIEA